MADMHTATVLADDFYRAALNASLFACKDDTLGVLCAVRFFAREDGAVTAEATNRYAASQESMPLVELDHDPAHEGHAGCPVPTTDLDVLVSVKSLVKVAKMLKQLTEPMYGTNAPPAVRIEWTEGERHVAFTVTRHLSPDQTLRAETEDGAYPRTIGRFYDQHRTVRDGESLPDGFQDWTFNPEYLAVLAKVDSSAKGTSARLSFGMPGRPLLVHIGERFRALIMPIRNAG